MVTTLDMSYTVGDERIADHIGEFQDLRRVHLKDLRNVEDVVRSVSPLPTTYDVNRTQPPYFQEFTHTECLGGLLVTPQSSEAAARLAQRGVDERHELDRDPTGWIEDRLRNTGSLDKYELEEEVSVHSSRVIFTPGSNLFLQMVSKEAVGRAMHEDPQLIIKPHPMTHDENLKMLCREYGYHRVAPPRESGWEYLKRSELVYAASTTEMALYGTLFGKEVRNISNFHHESFGVYYPFFRLKTREELVNALSSPYSGFFIPGDPPERYQVYFESAMELRDFFRPLAYEMSPSRWSEAKMESYNAVRPN